MTRARCYDLAGDRLHVVWCVTPDAECRQEQDLADAGRLHDYAPGDDPEARCWRCEGAKNAAVHAVSLCARCGGHRGSIRHGPEAPPHTHRFQLRSARELIAAGVPESEMRELWGGR
jgi:hypothetical protein